MTPGVPMNSIRRWQHHCSCIDSSQKSLQKQLPPKFMVKALAKPSSTLSATPSAMSPGTVDISRLNTGFTLIEVVIALVILAIALTAVMKALHDSIDDTMHVRDRMAAQWVAMDVLGRIRTGLVAAPASGSAPEGTARELNTRWRWKAILDQADTPTYFERIRVEVTPYHPSVRLGKIVLFGFVQVPMSTPAIPEPTS